MDVTTIDFYGDKLDIVDMGGQAGVAARRLVENLGLDWSTQREKLQDPLFNCGHMPSVGVDGKQREMMILPVKSLPAFLFSINPKKVREDLQEKLAYYRLECVDVLYNYWAKGYAINSRPTTEGILKDYTQGLGVVHTNFLDNLLDNQAKNPEHHNVMQQVIYTILTQALEVDELDLTNNTAKRRSGWVYLTCVELTVLQTLESEVGLYFAKHGVPETADKVMDMAKEIGKKTTSRLRRAMFVSENFSDQFEERIVDLLGMR